MLRWLNAFVSKPGQTIPGVEDEMFDNITVPTLIIRGGENDWDHPKRTSLEVSCLIKGSELIDPPWPEDAWERAAEERAQGKVKRFNMFDTWVQAAPADPRVPGALMSGRRIRDCAVSYALTGVSRTKPHTRRLSVLSHRVDVHLAVQRGLERGVDSALRHPRQVGFAQRHVHDVPAVASRRASDFAGQPEPGQHAVGVVVCSTADVGKNAGHRASAESLGAQVDCNVLGLSSSGSGPAISNSTSRRPTGIAERLLSTTPAPTPSANSRSAVMPSLNCMGVSTPAGSTWTRTTAVLMTASLTADRGR